MSSKRDLKLDWCSMEAARFACKHWHYSRRVPVFKSARIGVWECGEFVGVIMFGQGATPEIGSPFGLANINVCELTRVALRNHNSQVSRMLAISVRMLTKKDPGIKLIVSFADAAEGHHGGIYQAAGWIYCGSSKTHAYMVCGQVVHPKTLHSRFGVGGQSIPWLRQNVDPMACRIVSGVKHKYLKPCNEHLEKTLSLVARPYPKRVSGVDSDTSPHHGEEGGAIPTGTLKTREGDQ